MNERSISTESLHELSSANFATLQRSCDDLRSVCEAVEGLDSTLSFERSGGLHQKAAALRSQARHAFAAAAALSAAASSYELLAQVVDHSARSPLPAALPPSAKAKTSARRRKP
jgi:hypothetical protein